MINIHVLSPGFTNPNSTAFLMPFIIFRSALKEAGYHIRIFSDYKDGIEACDYHFIDSKTHKKDWNARYDQTLEKLSYYNAKTKVIWCDQADSSGTFLGQVLPHIHKYLKAQLLKDRNQYLKSHYASRIYAQYYHEKYGIQDEQAYIQEPVKDQKDLSKLDISWNSGLMNYGLFGPYSQRLREHIPINALLYFAKPLRKASAERPMDITCRMGISYPRETMRFQRLKIRELLKDHLPTNKLSRRAYFKELCESKICISPFGLGEITLKDFECFLTGSLLLKPQMNHMQTWPNLYEDKVTYIAHSWDLDDVLEQIEWALNHEKERIEIAQNGQNRYLDYTLGLGASDRFVEHFKQIITT